MTLPCPAIPVDTGFIGSMTAYMDCQAGLLGSGAWAALSAPGSSLSILLTSFLTILVAITGYNLLLGQSFTVRDTTILFVKLGAVLALATSWPAYRTLVYEVAVNGPAELAAELGGGAGVIGADGTLTQRLDMTDAALSKLAVLGPGNPTAGEADNVPPAPFVGFDAFALGGARILYLVTAVASLGALRIVTGLMLALGPFFIAFLLFENSRSLFEGWIRVLAGAALGTLGATLALGMELAMLEPWLSNVLARRMAGEALPAMPAELFVLILQFAIVTLAALAASARIARAFRLAPSSRAGSAQPRVEASTSRIASGLPAAVQGTAQAGQGPGRAAAVANLLVTMNRRDGGESGYAAGIGAAHVHAPNAGAGRPGEPFHARTPVGRSFPRRPNARVSAGASRRDGAA